MSTIASEIIEKFKDEYGYVKDLEKISAILKYDESLSINQRASILLEILEWNVNIDNLNKKKLKEKNKRIKNKEKEENNTEKENEEIETKTELMDVSSFINSLKKCEDDDFLTELLPSIYDNNYESIITSILLYFYNEITLAYKMISVEQDKESLLYLKDLIKTDKKIINIIKEYNKEEILEEDTLEPEKENTLIFLPKSADSLYIYQDIDDIAIEEDVIPILDDIKNNRITREKRFHNHQELKGISAIRKRNSRIIFSRLENNVIVILGILVKRFQNPLTYAEMLQSRNKKYKAVRDELKTLSKLDDFIDENNSTYEDIINILKSRKKQLIRSGNNGASN